MVKKGEFEVTWPGQFVRIEDDEEGYIILTFTEAKRLRAILVEFLDEKIIVGKKRIIDDLENKKLKILQDLKELQVEIEKAQMTAEGKF